MSASLRKFIGMWILLFGLILYIAAVVTIATAWLPSHWAAQTAFYVVAGVIWAIPLRPFMLWMNRPDPDT